MIDCKTAETMVNRYINQNLAPDELEEYLNHIEVCENCFDELETYFIAHEATRQLSQEEEDDYDFRNRLARDLRHSRMVLMRRKTIRFLLLSVLLILAAGAMGALLLRIL